MESAAVNPKDDPSLMSEHTDKSSIEVTGNPPISDEESDRFKDCDCGEPLLEQHIVLDFTPTEEDTDYVQRKCCAFWEFINQQDDLDGLIAEPDFESMSESSAGDYIPIQDDFKAKNQTLTPKLKSVEKTAVSMLELVEEKGLIDRAFESRLPTSHCSLGLNNYNGEESPDKAEEEPPKPRLSITPSNKSKSQMIRRQLDSQARVAATTNVRDMCKNLKEWDKKHPKSMQPPGPTPSLEDDAVELTAVKHTKQCVCENVCHVRKHKQ